MFDVMNRYQIKSIPHSIGMKAININDCEQAIVQVKEKYKALQKILKVIYRKEAIREEVMLQMSKLKALYWALEFEMKEDKHD